MSHLLRVISDPDVADALRWDARQRFVNDLVEYGRQDTVTGEALARWYAPHRRTPRDCAILQEFGPPQYCRPNPEVLRLQQQDAEGERLPRIARITGPHGPLSQGYAP